MAPDPFAQMLAAGLAAAFALGFLAHKLGLPAITGYLLAGILISPHTPGFAANTDLAGEAADLGVILALFGAGARFPPAGLTEFRWIAVPCALGQMAIAVLLGLGVAFLLGLPWTEGAIFGFCLSVAGAVVFLRVLEGLPENETADKSLGHSWMIVQAIAAMLILIAMPVTALQNVELSEGSSALPGIFGVKTAGLGLFIFTAILAGRRFLPQLLVFVARTKSRELFSLAIFALAFSIAFAVHALFGVSFALGAFVAGLVLSQTNISHRAAEDLMPLRDAFAVLFFLSLGVLLDWQILVTQSWTVLAVLAVVIFGNGGAAFLTMMLMRVPLDQRFIVAGGLTQTGEFSFLIAATALGLGLITEQTHGLILAGAVLSIGANPLIRRIAIALIWLKSGTVRALSGEADTGSPPGKRVKTSR